MRYLYILLALCLLTAQSAIDRRPNENLFDYKARMDAYFDPRIEAHDPELAAEGSDYSQYRQFMTFWEPRLTPHGDFARYWALEENYYTRYGRHRRPAAPHAFAGSDSDTVVNTTPWHEIGPKNMPSYSTTEILANHNGIGPVEFLQFHPTSPSHMLTGSTAGGLFYSTDGASTWTNTGTDTEIGRSGVSSAAFDPADFKTWFVSSSGNSNRNDAGPIGGVGGIFRTMDEGVSWTQIATPKDLGDHETRIVKILMHPTKSQLWAATSAGLYMTNDAMNTVKKPTWSLVRQDVKVYDLEFRPGDPQWMYAAISEQNLWRFIESSDGGATWHDVPGQPSTAGATLLTIEVTPANPTNVYFLVGHPNCCSELYIYDAVKKSLTQITKTACISHGAGHAFGVDTFNANRIYLSDGLSGKRYTGTGTGSYFGTLYHDDLEDLVSDPVIHDRVWMCDHGGIHVSSDAGASWTPRSNGLGVAQPLGMAQADNDPRYLGLGLYHDGTMFTDTQWSDPWAPSWAQRGDGDGMRPMISPTGQYWWLSYVYVSDNPWQRWDNYGKTKGIGGMASEWWSIAGGALNRNDAILQYRIGPDQALRRSTDWGATWSGPLSDFGSLYTGYTDAKNIYTSPTDKNYLATWVLNIAPNSKVIDGYAYRTKTALATPSSVIASWEKIPLPGTQQISDIEFDPRDAEVMYISTTASTADPNDVIGKGLIYRCSVSHCDDITQNLPNAVTGPDSLAMANDGSGGLYYLCDFGCFYSNDATRAAGNGWRPLGANLPHTSFNGVEINTINHKLRVAAHGRGAWEHDLVSTITGTLFHDLNHNGKRDAGEPPLAGWTVRLNAANATASAVTDANGRYTFSLLPPGTYTISQIVQSGWTQTLPASASYSIAVSAGDFRKSIDFADDLNLRTSCVWPNASGVAWWRLNEGQGATGALDYFGGHTASYVNAPQPVAGKVLNALHFNGTSQYLQTPSHAALNFGTGDFSIAAWIRTTSRDLLPIVDKRDPKTYTGYSFYAIDGRLGVQLSGMNWGTQPGVVNLADGQWHHVAVTIDRDDPNGGLLYVDGAIVLVFDPTRHNGSLDNSAALTIGMNDAGDNLWSGDLDEIVLFRSRLTPYEVQSIFKADHFGICSINDCNPDCV